MAKLLITIITTLLLSVCLIQGQALLGSSPSGNGNGVGDQNSTTTTRSPVSSSNATTIMPSSTATPLHSGNGSTMYQSTTSSPLGSINSTTTKPSTNDTKLCITCMIACPYGNVMGNDGCPMCKCNEPCQNVTCNPGQMCKETASLMCGSEACPNATFTGQCVLNQSDPCSKCVTQCPYGFNKTASPTCTECKCLDPCLGRQCLAGMKCQAVAIDICGDVPCSNTSYLGVCVPSNNRCPVPCLHFCDFGFVLGADGCPTCKCAQPCKNYTCGSGKKCKEVANNWCNGVACPNSTYSPSCEMCSTCNKFCPFGRYIASNGCPSCDCMEPCRGSNCQPGFRCHEKPSVMCGSEPCANTTYYPECIANECRTCNNYCPYGYNMDSYGCPTCECKQPCKDVKCDDGLMCKEIGNIMCGNVSCFNSTTYSGKCVALEQKCVECTKVCPYGYLMGANNCTSCVCIEPCMNVACGSGMQCIADKRPLCGNVPCANATYVGVCVESSQAVNKTYISSTDTFDLFFKDVTHLSHEALVCAGNTETLSCPEDQTVTVVSAFLGRNSSTACIQGWEGSAANLRYSLPDATRIVTELCENKQQCDLSPDMEEFGHPVAAVSLYLKVDYLCRPKIHKTLQCSDTGRMQLQCAPGTTLNILSAFYGRDDMNTTCPHPFAIITNNCSNNRAFDIVKEACNGRSSCFVGADSYTFSDPCPHSNKYLRMEYQCLGCTNDYGDDAKCQMWANQGYCDSNKDWMMAFCNKACTRCEKEMECVNVEKDVLCDSWAAGNECINNPSFMYAYCRKSCLKCDQKTQCYNKYNDYNTTACDIWMRSNECTLNSKFMLSYCTKSCFGCDKNVKCTNTYPDDKCDLWAIAGECDKNPGFMVSQCYKSCFNCDKDPVCENYGASDAQCDQWAKDDECVKNPSFMYRYCWKSCMQCQPTGLPACTNYWGDVWCEQLALQGDCMKSGVLNVCYKSCSRCGATLGVSDCINTNDTMCDEIVRSGRCFSDPVTSISLCKRSCTMCDQPTLQTAYFGGGLMPGDILDYVSGYTIVADTIKVRARLAYFSAFFVSDTPFYLQIWRPWGTDNFYQVFNQYVKPKATNCAQTIPVEGGCVQVSAGDRIGFTTIQGPPPMATSFDPSKASEKVYLRQGTKSDTFTQAGFSIRFSINAHVIPGQC